MSGLDDLTDGEPEPLPKDDRKEYQRRIAELEQQVEQLERSVSTLRKPRLRINPTRMAKRTDEQFIRVMPSDNHGCLVDQAAASAFFGDLEILQPKEIIHLGDILDCGGFLAQHHTIGFVAEAAYSYEEDCAEANQFLDIMQRVSPESQIDLLEGNHDQRPERWIINQTLRHEKDAEALRNQWGVEARLSLKARGITYHRRSEVNKDSGRHGTIKRGACYFTHGHRHGKHAAKSMLDQFGANVVFGDTHRRQCYTAKTVGGGEHTAWTCGCLRTLQPMYKNVDMTDHVHGYGLQFVNPDGTFFMIQVPIINGRSLLVPFLEMAGAG